MGVTPMELVGLVCLTAAFGLIVAGAFLAAVLAGIFTLGGLLALIGVGLLYLAAYREAAAKAKGLHAVGGNRSAA